MNRNGQGDDLASSTTFKPFACFVLIWACTTLAHQLAFTFWTESWQGWVLVIAAIACLFQPNCVFRFTFLVFSSLLNLYHKLPFVPNHILFEGMLQVMMVIGLLAFFVTKRRQGNLDFGDAGWRGRILFFVVAVAIKAIYFLVPGIPRGYYIGAPTTLLLLFATGKLLFHRGRVSGGDDFFHAVAPVMRIALLIMYMWAALQKLNHDYLNPEISCAAKLHIEIASYFGPLVPTAEWALHGAIWGSFLFEIGIPILLYIPKTRFFGFIAAVWFHLWLAIHPAAGIFSFSSLILALLFLFLPSQWGESLQQSWNRQLTWLGRGKEERGRLIARWIVILVFFITLIVQGSLYLLIERSYEIFHRANRIGFFTFFAWGCWLGGCYLWAGWKSRGESVQLPNQFRCNVTCIALIFVIANGIWPWIGGRTQTSFSMYSNLRSEGKGNHLFLKRIDLLPFQKDMVEILESEPDILLPSNRPRGIQQFANIGHRVLPWFEFRRLVSEAEGDLEVRYSRNGEEHTLSRTGTMITGDTEAFEELPLLQRKFLWFRRLERLDGPMICTH